MDPNQNQQQQQQGGLGGLASSLGGHSAQPAAGQQQGGGDYGDKAFSALSKKSGHNINPSTSEKITDGARGLFEKATGKKVDSKYSN